MRAAIYMRVGRAEEPEPQHQAEILTKQIQHMWGDRTRIDIYADRGISGLQPVRPGLQKLLQEAGTYNGVFVSSMDRLSRSIPEAVRLARQLKDSGTELYTPDGKDGNMVENMEKVMAVITGLST